MVKLLLVFSSFMVFVALAVIGGVQLAHTGPLPAPSPNSPLQELRMSNDIQLEKMLAPFGISVETADLVSADSDSSRVAVLKWVAEGNDDAVVGYTSQAGDFGTLSLSDLRRFSGSPSRQRSLEMSPELVLVTVLDDRKRLLWWNLVPDPRILRAETANDRGELSGSVLYRTRADLVFGFPADARVVELKIFHPEWNGGEHNLSLIGSVNVEGQ